MNSNRKRKFYDENDGKNINTTLLHDFQVDECIYRYRTNQENEFFDIIRENPSLLNDDRIKYIKYGYECNVPVPYINKVVYSKPLNIDEFTLNKHCSLGNLTFVKDILSRITSYSNINFKPFMHKVIDKQDSEMLQVIISHPLFTIDKDVYENMIISKIIDRNYPELFKCFIDSDKVESLLFRNILVQLIEKNRIEMIKMAIDTNKLDPRTNNRLFFTILEVMCVSTRIEMITCLIQKYIEYINNDEMTEFFNVKIIPNDKNNNVVVIRKLLSFGKINTPDKSFFALRYCAGKGYHEIVKDLLQYDHEKFNHVVSVDHFRAIRDADHNDHGEIIKLLFDYILSSDKPPGRFYSSSYG